MTTVRRVILAMLLPLIALPAAAQSPNTSALIVVVVDQTGGVVSDAKVTVVNNATGAARESLRGGDGSATIGETATVIRSPWSAGPPAFGSNRVEVAADSFVPALSPPSLERLCVIAVHGPRSADQRPSALS